MTTFTPKSGFTPKPIGVVQPAASSTNEPANEPASDPAAKPSLAQQALANLAAKTQAGTFSTKVNVPTPAQPATTTPTPKPAGLVIPTKTQAKLAAQLPKPAAPKKLAEVQTSIKAIAAQQEAARIGKAVTEVPEELYKLDPAIYQISGLQAEALSQCLAKTYISIIEDQPDLGGLLEAIDKNMRQYEELSYLLTPAQIGLYVDGLMKKTGTMIKTTAPKVSAAKVASQLQKDGGLDPSLLLM